MFELVGLVTIKILGHGWLWNKGEHIDSDEAFGNGGPLMGIGLVVSVLGIVGFFVLALTVGK
jgi:hypothetical protein